MTNVVAFPGLGITGITLNRVAFSIGGKAIYWYGIIIAIGFILAFVYTVSRLHKLGITTDDLVDTIILSLIIGLVLARLYFVVFYKDPVTGTNTYFAGTPKEIFLKCVALWNGGSSIFGALLGAIIAMAIISKVKKIPIGPILDTAAVGLPIGQVIGRLGNFINCELYGVPTPENFFLRMEINGAPGVHPLFLYEMVWNIFVFIMVQLTLRKRRFDGHCFVVYIGLYGLGRGFIELLKADTHMLGNIKISCVLSFACFIVALAIMIFEYTRRKPAPNRLYVNRLREAARAAASASAGENAETFEAPEKESSPEAGDGPEDTGRDN